MEPAPQQNIGMGLGPNSQEADVYVKREDVELRNCKRVRGPSDTVLEEPLNDRANKNPRIDSFEALDPEVRVKLRSMFDKGVIKEDELDDTVLVKLGEFPPEDAVECLEQFCKCDISKIRNKSAYLIGVIRRVRSNIHSAGDGYNPGGGGVAGAGLSSAMAFLDKTVQIRLTMLFSDGVCKPSDIDEKCLEALGQLPPRGALEALAQFVSRDLSDVRSYSRFLMSIIRRVRKDFDVDGGVPAPNHQNLAYVDQRPVGINMGVNMAQLGPMGPVMTQLNPNLAQLNPNVGLVAPVGISPAGVGTMIAPGPAGNCAYDPLQPTAMGQQLIGLPGSLGVMSGIITPDAPGGKHDYGLEQMRMGVRVDEFHRLSIHAPYVHYALALKLQELWDSGVKLVAQLDDKVWQQLTEMRTVDALVCIESVVNDIDRIKNPNAYFMSMARHFNGRTRSGLGGVGNRRCVRAVRNGPSGGRINQVGDLASLAPEIRQRIEDIVRSRTSCVRRTDFDKGVCDELMDLQEHKALGVLEELQSQPLNNVKNMSAFIMSICRRYKKSR